MPPIEKETTMSETGAIDLKFIRDRLSTTRNKEYWRCLEELADTESFRDLLHKEFPRHASALTDAIDRRDFLKLMGASLALAGLSGCLSSSPAPPDEKIVPYVRQPEEIVPGKPLFFATAMPFAGFGRGVLAESHMGRPTKVEGNPEHPATLGAADVFMQASILELYDPDRSRVLNQAGRINTWNAFVSALNAELETQRLNQGTGLRILTETVTSPTLAYQLRELLKRFRKAKWHQYEPVGRDFVHEGSRLAFGEVVQTLYRFDKAEVILSLDADFLFFGPASLRYAHDFANKRRVKETNAAMNRLYLVESTPTVTGAMADHRLPLRPSEIEGLTRAVARGLGIQTQEPDPTGFRRYEKWARAVVRDLQSHRGSSVVLAGDQQSPIVHALAHAMNQALGNVGATVLYTDPVEAQPIQQSESIRELVHDMEANQVQVLIIIGGNPAHTVPPALNFASNLIKANFTVHLSLYENETSALCHWHVPEAHYLESWSDVRAYDGTATIIQPLIAPLYGGRTAHEILAALLGQPSRSSYEVVRDYWMQQRPAQDFEPFWRTALHDGIVAGKAASAKPISLARNLAAKNSFAEGNQRK